MYGKVQLLTTWMDLSTILIFINSCVNPFLYGLAIKKYRKSYWEVVKCCCPCVSWAQEHLGGVKVGAENQIEVELDATAG